MAEALLRERLAARGIAGRVSSTGLLFDDRPAPPEVVAAMARRGVDLAPHRSRVLTSEQLEAADLVLAMERQHVREAYLLSPSALGRMFTLREFVRRALPIGPVAGDLRSWIAQVSAGRRPGDLVGESSDDDTPDPFGLAAEDYERTATELDELCDWTADLLAGRMPDVPPTMLADPAVVASGPGGDRLGGRNRLWRRA